MGAACHRALGALLLLGGLGAQGESFCQTSQVINSEKTRRPLTEVSLWCHIQYGLGNQDRDGLHVPNPRTWGWLQAGTF